MYTLLMIIQLLVGLTLIALVLLQHGKGADAGAAFGSGASGTVFGSRGAANFLSRATAWLAAVFFGVSLALAYLVHSTRDDGSLVDQLEQSVEGAAAPVPTAPAIPEDGAAPAAPADAAPTAPAVPE